eukprot:7526733-Lingulodinium_polyedra.AAC.1
MNSVSRIVPPRRRSAFWRSTSEIKPSWAVSAPGRPLCRSPGTAAGTGTDSSRGWLSAGAGNVSAPLPPAG